MDFEESLFDDFQSKKEKKEKQCPYIAMRQEVGWFLSPNIVERSDQTQPSYILKYKADYFYGQCEYVKALNCYTQLSQLVPATNIMLSREIKESIIICLKKMNKHTEAMDAIKELIRTNKTDASLWLLLSSIHRDTNDTQGALFALQCCLQHNEEIANYWIELAKCYTYLSCCINMNDLRPCCLAVNAERNEILTLSTDISQVVTGLEQHNLQQNNISNKELDNRPGTEIAGKILINEMTLEATEDNLICVKDGNSKTSSNEENSISDKELDNRPGIEIVEKINDMTLDKVGTFHSKDASDIQACDSKPILNEEDMVDNLNQYIQNHHRCFCTLCSLIIARFLHHKYSFHSSPLQSNKRNENVLKVSEMINALHCVTPVIVETTEKLLHQKFATSRRKQEHPTETDKITDLFGQNVIQRIQDFEKHWFPLL